MSRKKAKKANGEGNIRERDDGRWEGRLVFRIDGDPKPHRKSIYGRTRRDVHAQITTALRDLGRGVVPQDDRITVKRFMQQWLADREQHLRPTTLRRYKQVSDNYIVPALGDVTLTKLTPAQVQHMLRDAQRAGRSPRTVGHIRAVLRAALSRAVRWDMVVRNVAALADPPRIPAAKITPLTVAEAQRVLQVAGGTDLEAIVTVALMMGLRQSEILGLTWSAIDYDAGIVHVDRQLQRVDHAWELVEVKTASSRRVVPLPPRAAKALQRERSRQAARQLVAEDWQEPIPDLVFTGLSGRPLHGSSVTHTWQKTLLPSAEISSRPFHSLRGSCVSLLASQGMEITTVKELMGHTDIRTTMNVYAGALPARKTEAAARMEALLGSA